MDQYGNFLAKSMQIVLFSVSGMVAQQKMVLVVSGLSPLELMHTVAVFPQVVGFVVDNMFAVAWCVL